MVCNKKMQARYLYCLTLTHYLRKIHTNIPNNKSLVLCNFMDNKNCRKRDFSILKSQIILYNIKCHEPIYPA